MADSNPYQSSFEEEPDRPAPTLPNSTYWKLTGLLGVFVVVPWFVDRGLHAPMFSLACLIPFVAAVVGGVVKVLWYYAHRDRSMSDD